MKAIKHTTVLVDKDTIWVDNIIDPHVLFDEIYVVDHENHPLENKAIHIASVNDRETWSLITHDGEIYLVCEGLRNG